MHKLIKFIKSFSVISSIQTIIVYLYVFFLARYGSESDYADYITTTYIVDFTVAIALFGFNLLLLRENISFIKDNCFSILFISGIVSAIIALIYFSLINPSNITIIIYSLVLITLNYLYQFGFAILIKLQKNRLALTISLTNILLVLLTLILCAVFNKLTYVNVVSLRSLQVAIFVFCGFFPTIKLIQPKFNLSFHKILDCFKTALPIGGGTIIGNLTQYSDKIISSTLSSGEIARYSIARFDIPFIGIFINNMSYVYMEKIKQAINIERYDDAITNIKLLFKYGWYFNIIVFTLLFCNTALIIKILYSAKFLDSDILFKIILLSYLLKPLPYSNIIVALGIEKIILKRMLVELVLQISCSLILLHTFGIIGLAISIILVLLLWSVPYNLYYFAKTLRCKIKDLIPVKEVIKSIFKTFLPCLISSLIISRYCYNSDLIILLITCIIVVLTNIKEIKFILNNTK